MLLSVLYPHEVSTFLSANRLCLFKRLLFLEKPQTQTSESSPRERANSEVFKRDGLLKVIIIQQSLKFLEMHLIHSNEFSPSFCVGGGQSIDRLRQFRNGRN